MFNGKPNRAIIQIQAVIIVVLALVAVVAGYYYWYNQNLSTDMIQYVAPEEVGWSSEKLDSIKHLIEESGYSAIIVAYDGKIFYSYGEVSKNYNLHSIRKPLESALYGIQVDRGDIDLDETLMELGVDDIPPSLTDEEKQATVRELIQARSGVYHEAAAEAASMVELRPTRGSHPHGTFYYYNNWDFNVAISVFNQKTGIDSLDAFKSEIADPIGMEDFSLENCRYGYESEKSQFPAIQIRMSARDATYSVVDEDFGVGYGYMWYTIPEVSKFAQMVGSSGFYHTGLGVQVMIVLPELKLVIVELIDTDTSWWFDPETLDRKGDLGMQIGLEILNARN
jgi:CubicO group peptidase (beta-lactamase class C family)